MKFRYILGFILATSFFFSCQPKQDETISKEAATEQNDSFDYLSEQFADIKILRYQIPGFEQLTMQQKKYVYLGLKLKSALPEIPCCFPCALFCSSLTFFSCSFSFRIRLFSFHTVNSSIVTGVPF